MTRLALSEQDLLAIQRRFTESSPSEEGAFLLLRGDETTRGDRLVASAPYFPRNEEWDRRGPHQLRPSARLISAMVSRANAARCGLLFVHSHPDPRHPTDFSYVDMAALDSLGPTVSDLVDGPFAAAVQGPDGWRAIALTGGRWLEIERIAAASSAVRILNPLVELDDELDDRQRSALGRTHIALRNLDVVVVGAGGLGSPLVECLVRMGVRRVVVIDYDRLDTKSNVRRVFGSRMEHLEAEPKLAKATVIRDHCRQIGLPVDVYGVAGDVRHKAMLRHILDCDVVLCATDSHSSRAVLDGIAYAFHLPLIDCGVRIGVRNQDRLASLVSEIRVVGPGLPCLWCMGALSAERIRAENLPDDQREVLVREGYVAGVPRNEPSTAALTLFGAGMMASALLGMLSEESDILPKRYVLDALLADAPPLAPEAIRSPDCICGKRLGKGSDTSLGFIR